MEKYIQNNQRILRYQILGIGILLFAFSQTAHSEGSQFRGACRAVFYLIGIGQHPSIPNLVRLPLEPLPQFEEEPLVCRQRYISPEDIVEAQRTISQVSSPELQAEVAFSFYLDIRLANYETWFVRKIKHLIKNRMETIDSSVTNVGGQLIAKPFIFGGVSMQVLSNPLMIKTATYYSVLAHEAEHLIQWIDREYHAQVKGSTDRGRYDREFGAIRAEFEYWSLIPDSLKQRDLKIASQLPDLPLGRTQTTNLIRASSQGFAEFRKNHVYRSLEAVTNYYKYDIIPDP